VRTEGVIITDNHDYLLIIISIIVTIMFLKRGLLGGSLVYTEYSVEESKGEKKPTEKERAGGNQHLSIRSSPGR
jgi:hypothetical protein